MLYANRTPRRRAFLLLRLLLLLLLLSSGASVLQTLCLSGSLDAEGRFLLPFTPPAFTLRALPQSRIVLSAAV